MHNGPYWCIRCYIKLFTTPTYAITLGKQIMICYI